ncbi:MAG: hypothetical protein CL927_16490 [Deltaproteobacteria bacterium]|nr:hypothetical protein [Deltaproteobacteria bacterium]HCH61761.1 hypothetical protein [Deltaproteobacteria bacterium]
MSRARRRRASRRTRTGPTTGEPRLDLHLHSTSSDGKYAPSQVLSTAAERGLHTIALTDHDIPPTLAAGEHEFGRRRIRLIHAAEVSAVYDGIEFHLLAYFPRAMPAGFRSFLTERARARAERYNRAAEQLSLPLADERASTGQRALTRYHLAQELVMAGHCGSIHAAFAGPLASRKAVVPAIELTVESALRTMEQHGAISVWAHPSANHAPVYAPTFARLGLRGLEAYRPSASHTQRAAIARLALDLGLVVTGGSDWHGWRGRLGSFRMKASEVAAFLELLEQTEPTEQDSVRATVDHPGPQAVDHI